jgi:hypothetical protein
LGTAEPADMGRSSTSSEFSTRKHRSQAEFREQILQDPPITVARVTSVGAFEVVLQIVLYAVVIEQRIIDVYQEDSAFS